MWVCRYFPRGMPHQAVAQSDGESLHLTFSTYQAHTWYDLIERAAGPENAGMMQLLGTAPGRIHTDLPRDLLDKARRRRSISH